VIAVLPAALRPPGSFAHFHRKPLPIGRGFFVGAWLGGTPFRQAAVPDPNPARRKPAYDQFHFSLSPGAGLLRLLQALLEHRFDSARLPGTNGGDWERILIKWDAPLSNTFQRAPPKGSFGTDLDAETQRLFDDHVSVPRTRGHAGLPGGRSVLRSYRSQVVRNAQLWDRVQKSVCAAEFTFPGESMHLDYGYGPQRHARLRADAFGLARPRRCQAFGLHR
jgi:hypothetical protein